MAASFESRSLEDPGLQGFIAQSPQNELAASSEWNLRALTLAALYFSPELDVARAKWKTSRAAALTAAQIPNPALQFSLGYSPDASSDHSSRIWSIGVDVPVETAGKRGYRTTRGERLADAGRLEIKNVAWQVRSRLRARLLEWHVATRRVATLEQAVLLQGSIAEMLGKRLELGAASAPEENQSRISLLQNTRDLANARRQITDAMAQGASAIGIPVAALENVRVTFDDAFDEAFPDVAREELRREAVLRRPDLLGALSEYQASEAALQTEIAKQYPDVHLGPGYTFEMGTRKLKLAVSAITLPLFNRNEGPIAEVIARRSELAARFNASQAAVLGEVDRALRSYQTARSKVALADSLLASQHRQLESVRRGFEAGETDRLARDLARRSLLAIEQSRNDALLQVQQSVGQLEDAVQRPLSKSRIAADPEIEPRRGIR